RAYYSALWRACAILPDNCTIWLLNGCFQPSPDIHLYPFFFYMALQGFHQQLMVYLIKETFDVHIQHPCILTYILLYGFYCLMGTFQWTITIRVVMELCFQTWL